MSTEACRKVQQLVLATGARANFCKFTRIVYHTAQTASLERTAWGFFKLFLNDFDSVEIATRTYACMHHFEMLKLLMNNKYRN